MRRDQIPTAHKQLLQTFGRVRFHLTMAAWHLRNARRFSAASINIPDLSKEDQEQVNEDAGVMLRLLTSNLRFFGELHVIVTEELS
jgi:hypothetical protein